MFVAGNRYPATTTSMFSAKLSRTEFAVLTLLGLSVLAGYLFLFIDVALFEAFVSEDGLVEWFTVGGLLLASFTCFSRFVKLRKEKGGLFLLFLILGGFVFFFGAGEEISWGQRLLGIESPEYFRQNNAQGETNIHNLLVGGVKLNRVIFTIMLAAFLGIYILLVPFLYRRKVWMRRLVDYWGIPLPQPYQIAAFLLMFLLVQLMPHMGKRDEISEEGTALLLYLMVAFPFNRQSFEVSKKTGA